MGLPSLTLLLLTLLGVRGQGPALQGSFIWSPSAPAGQQAYVAFRSPSFLLSTLTSATVHIFADSRYLLYVNGGYILRGPCRFNPKWPEYDSVDVTASLRPGQNNSIVALVHSYGPVINGRIMSHAPGLALSLEVNGAPLLSSSPAWRSSRATQYQGSPPAWSSIPDVIDARALAPLGGDWTQPHFNDSAWEPSALVSGSAWGALQARSLPLPLEDPLPPPLALPAGAPLALPLTLQVGQSITLNLTQMAMVYAVVGLDAGAAGAGAVLHLEFALRFRGGAPAETYGVGTQYTASAGAQSFVSLDQWCAHYLTITCVSGSPLTLTSLSLVRRAYPFQRLGAFNSSDALVSEVWRRAVNTLAAVTDDAYGSDARERNEWLQDPAQPNFITTRVALVGPPLPGSSRPAFSDARLLKNLLRHAALSQLPDGRILSTFPTDRGPEDCHYAIEDYAMQFMEALRAYFDSSGDLAFVREVYPVVLAQMANFKGRVVGNGSASGAVSGLLLARQYTSFDDALAYVTVQGGALNAFYARSLGDCAYLAGLVGDAAQAAQFAADAAAIASRFNDALWNASVGSYNSGILPSGAVVGPSVHAALLALERGLVPPSRLDSVRAFFLQNYRNNGSTHCCTNTDTAAMIAAKSGVDFPVVYYWVFRTLYALDSDEGDLEALGEVRRRWGAMVEGSPDIDTLWESFQDSESCHNYGAVPAFFLSSYVLGVHFPAPGSLASQGLLVVEPRLGDLQRAGGRVVTEAGIVEVQWERAPQGALGGCQLAFTLALPQDVQRTELRLVGEAGTLVLNGKQVNTSQDGRYQVAMVEGGDLYLSGSIQCVN